MKEKLTRSDVWDWINPTRDRDRDGLCESFWSQIEADRAVTRDETRNEFLRAALPVKGLSSSIDGGRTSQKSVSWGDRIWEIEPGMYQCFIFPDERVPSRHIPKKRPKTPRELISDYTEYVRDCLKGTHLMMALIAVSGNPDTVDMGFLTKYCQEHGISTEVDE